MSVNVNQTVETVEQSSLQRKEKWTKKLKEFAGIGDNSFNWTRQSFEQDLRELRTVVKNLDERIGDLETSIQDKERQIRNRLDSYDEISNAGLEELESKSLADGSNPTHGVNKKKVFGDEWPTEDNSVDEDSLVGLYRKKGVLQEIKSTLRKIGLDKMETIGKGYKRDFVSGEVAETVQEDVSDRLHNEAEKLELQMENKLNTSVADLESKIKVVNSRLNQIEKNLEMSGTDLDEGKVDLSSNDGSVTDEPEITETEKDISEYSLDGKDLEDQREVMQEITESEDVFSMSVEEVASKTDVSADALEKILDDLEDEYSTRYGIV